MFQSFFPSPRLFFSSAIAWSLVVVLVWFFLARDAGGYIGLPNPPSCGSTSTMRAAWRSSPRRGGSSTRTP